MKPIFMYDMIMISYLSFVFFVVHTARSVFHTVPVAHIRYFSMFKRTSIPYGTDALFANPVLVTLA
jgi:hypothetical protein